MNIIFFSKVGVLPLRNGGKRSRLGDRGLDVLPSLSLVPVLEGAHRSLRTKKVGKSTAQTHAKWNTFPSFNEKAGLEPMNWTTRDLMIGLSIILQSFDRRLATLCPPDRSDCAS